MSALLGDQSWSAIEAAYRSADPIRYAVIDDFLAPGALCELHAALLNDRGWSFNPAQAASRYLPRPAASQVEEIAQALRRHLPAVLDGLQLVEHWAFLHPRSGGLRPHFDVGAVTINLWMTDDAYNRAPGRSGLVLYGVRRPAEVPPEVSRQPGWADELFERDHDGTEVRIAHRRNRAVLFESPLFHASDTGEFDAHDLESSRINLTFLFDEQGAYERRRERFGYA